MVSSESASNRTISAEVDPLRRESDALAVVESATGEGKYRQLVETCNDLIWEVDVEGRWKFLNRKATREIYGYEIEELLGRPFTEIVPPEQLAKDLAAFQEIKDGKAYFRHPTRHRRKDGSIVHLLYNAVPVKNAAGEVTGTTGTATDITERVKLEQELFQAQKVESIGRLAGGVAHDFNNILTSILGFAELAHAESTGSSRQRQHLEAIVESAKRGSALTQQLLSFARRRVVQPEVVDVRARIRSIVPMLDRLLGEDVDLVVEACDEPCTVRVDTGSLEQVIVNLAVNARDAMPTGGRLSISTHRARTELGSPSRRIEKATTDCVVIEVRDRGTGMSAETLAHIFEPFFTTKPAGEGTGLGLAVCHGIVNQAGGRIEVESAVGEGTVFRVFLPYHPDSPSEVLRPLVEELPQNEGRRGESILIVEDDDLVRRLAADVLTRYGHRVVDVADGEDALRAIDAAKEPFALVVADLVMPRLGGKELGAAIAQRGSKTRVLYTSGYSDRAFGKGGEIDPTIEYLHKPYTPVELLKRVRSVLDAR